MFNFFGEYSSGKQLRFLNIKVVHIKVCVRIDGHHKARSSYFLQVVRIIIYFGNPSFSHSQNAIIYMCCTVRLNSSKNMS